MPPIVLVVLVRTRVLQDRTGLLLPFPTPWSIQPPATPTIKGTTITILTKPGTTTRLPKALETLYVSEEASIVFRTMAYIRTTPNITAAPVLNRHLYVPVLQRD